MKRKQTAESIRDTAQTRVRFPTDLKKRIKETADNNDSSQNEIIVTAVEKYFFGEDERENRIDELLEKVERLTKALENKKAL